MKSRRIFGHIKSLLHFDFPYYANNTELRLSTGVIDEGSPEFWSFIGDSNLDGGMYKRYTIPSGAPKFGWRCLRCRSANDYISGSNNNNTFILRSHTAAEIECFIQPADSNAGNLISFLNNNSHVFTISREASGKIRLTSSQWGLNGVSSAEIGINSWHHLRVRISANTIQLFIDGVSCLSSALTPNITLSITECRIGGIFGYFDEFVFRDAVASSNSVPTSQYQAQLDLEAMGGTGTGKHGALTIKKNVSQRINGYSEINSGKNGSNVITLFNIGWHPVIGNPVPGDEVMLLIMSKNANSTDALTGRYAFRYITAINGTHITLDSNLDNDFSLTEAVRDYHVYIIHIPHYTSVNVEEGGQLLGHFNGLCAFRRSGNVNISGCIAPYGGKGKLKVDNVVLTPSSLPDRYIMSLGGGVMIFCGGTLTVTASSVIGRTPQNHAKANSCGMGGNGGGANAQIGGIQAGGSSADFTVPNWKNYGSAILIVAKISPLVRRLSLMAGLMALALLLQGNMLVCYTLQEILTNGGFLYER